MESLRQHSDFNDLKPYLVKSLTLHVLVVLFFTVKYLIGPSETITYIPSIKVDVVGLPDKATPEAKPVPKPKPQKKTAKVSKKTPVKKAKKSPPKKKAVNLDKKKSENVRKNALERMKALEKIRSQVQQEAQKEEVIKGNRVTPGSSMSGLVRLDYNQYIGSLEQHARNNWAIPKWLSGSNLSAAIRVYLDENGNVIRRELTQSSGDESFDDSVVTAITNASPFPAPQNKFIDVVRVDGITFILRP